MVGEIKNRHDVESFMKQLVAEGTNAHPDEDFNNYINMGSGLATYTPEEAGLRNTLMTQCFDVCESDGTDIYSMMQEVFLVETGLDKFIPLPSGNHFS